MTSFASDLPRAGSDIVTNNDPRNSVDLRCGINNNIFLAAAVVHFSVARNVCCCCESHCCCESRYDSSEHVISENLHWTIIPRGATRELVIFRALSRREIYYGVRLHNVVSRERGVARAISLTIEGRSRFREKAKLLRWSSRQRRDV